MRASGERSWLKLRGLDSDGAVRGAVLALRGVDRAELERSCDLAAMLADRCLLVAVNGGLRSCLAARRRPDLFVGDGDSADRIPDDIPAVVFPTDKDFSDMAGALEELRKRKVRLVIVAGLLGGRVDHEWANLLELGRRSRPFAGLLAPTERGTVLVTRRGCRAATVRGRIVSLFALGAGANVTLSGTRWELSRQRVAPGSLGLSNETGTELDLTVHSGVVALVFLPTDSGT
jgi:thiamine pyrophosphokinase